MPFRAPEKADLRNDQGSHNAKPFSLALSYLVFVIVQSALQQSG